MNKTLARVVAVLVVGAAVVLGALAYRMNEKAEMGRRLLAEFQADLARVEVDANGRRYIDALAVQYHEDAFAASFGPDAPGIGGTSDVNAYQRALIDSMISQAGRDGSKDVAAALEKFKASGAQLQLTDETETR